MIPKPREEQMKEGTLFIGDKIMLIDETKGFSSITKVIQKQMEEWLHIRVFIEQDYEEKNENQDATKIELKPMTIKNKKTEEAKTQVGAYQLEMTPDKITVWSGDLQGAFYGVQSLIQLIVESPTVSCRYIEDAPRYPWRGLMVDVSRCFYPVPVIKSILDEMAFLKLNIFHWHLTDDQGFRVPIKKYPKLTEGQPHYTHEEIKEVVHYAKERCIDIVPEIDMPGHFTASIAAYPYLGCTGEAVDVPEHFGVFKTIACGGKETTYQFIRDVLDEVCQLFPYEYIHLGGDEARKDQWKQCPHCQKKIQKEGLEDVEALQGYFMNGIFKYLMDTKGKKVIGWNENLHAKNLDERLVIQHWYDGKGRKNSRKALQEKREMIISDTEHVYFDYPYCVTPLKKVYRYAPVFKGISEEGSKTVKGVEATIWTEFIREKEVLEKMLYPRLHALAEVGWTEPQNKDYSDFLRRLEPQSRFMRKRGICGTPIEEGDMSWIKAKTDEFIYRRRVNKIHKRNKKLNA